MKSPESIEILPLDVLSYESFINNETTVISTLIKALHEKGIVGIRGIPSYCHRVEEFITALRTFSALPEEIKMQYAPKQKFGQTLGYEKGGEKLQRPDGEWVIDSLKSSIFEMYPDCLDNVWPTEVNLRDPFLHLAEIMSEMGVLIMTKIGLIAEDELEGVAKFGRMLHYTKPTGDTNENPFWCGDHFDHGLFTALLPAFYFAEGEPKEEPIEAGLFVRNTKDGSFKKIVANDLDVLLFQVGEFGQLALDDKIRATQHHVHKAHGAIERFTLAIFFGYSIHKEIHSISELTEDSRYPGGSGSPCTFEQWHLNSLARYRATP